MAEPTHKKRIWGWMMYDFASQPYHTLIISFIFAPFFAELMIGSLTASGMEAEAAKAAAQAKWGYGLTIAGLTIAFFAPVLGAISDTAGRKMPWIWLFSAAYVVGASGLWLTRPDAFDANLAMMFFGIGLIGVEFTTIFTNALLPSLGTRDEIGRISGNGWAFGYVGGIGGLIVMLALFAENAEGLTFIGGAPALGLDPELREGTRFVGPFTALFFLAAMIPFYLWVKEPKPAQKASKGAITQGLRDLGGTLKSLPKRRSLFAYLTSSMFYRDALNGVFAFGGVYAVGALGWSVTDFGVFGILAALSGAVFTYFGGMADARFGPKPVIVWTLVFLIATCIFVISISREMVLFIPVAEGSGLPDKAFMLCGILLGAFVGVLQSASRTMMVRQADPERMAEAFGLYALSGKATTFIAPALIAVVSDVTNSQRLGITPLIGLFLIGFILLAWVNPEGAEVE